MSTAQFKSAACAILNNVMNCSNLLIVDARPYSSFANAGSGVGQPLNGSNQLNIESEELYKLYDQMFMAPRLSTSVSGPNPC